MTKPLLSICIPTYNRAVYLKDCLDSICKQITAAGGEVELIVSDNDSTDNTYEIVEHAKQVCAIKYSKNKTNVGAAKNVLKLVDVDAVGEFCWVIGDDDIIKPGGVSAILHAIKNNRDLDFFYVNYSLHSPEEKNLQLKTKKEIIWKTTGNKKDTDGRVDDWCQLVGEDSFALTPIYASVFRRSQWINSAGALNFVTDFDRLESTYPHTVIFSKTMIGKQAYRVSYPWVSVFVGHASWSKYEPLVIIKRFPELLEQMKKNGIDDVYLKNHRKRIISMSGKYIINIISGKKYEMLDKKDAYYYLSQHFYNPIFLRSIISSAAAAMKKFF